MGSKKTRNKHKKEAKMTAQNTNTVPPITQIDYGAINPTVQVTPNIDQLETIEQSWSEVDAIYQATADIIVTVAESLNTVVHVLVNNGVKEDRELLVLTKGLKSDLEAVTTELLAINSLHKDRTGVIDNEDDLALSYMVFDDYRALHDKFKSIVFPTMLTFHEWISEFDAHQAKLAATEEQEQPVSEETIITEEEWEENNESR